MYLFLGGLKMSNFEEEFKEKYSESLRSDFESTWAVASSRNYKKLYLYLVGSFLSNGVSLVLLPIPFIIASLIKPRFASFIFKVYLVLVKFWSHDLFGLSYSIFYPIKYAAIRMSFIDTITNEVFGGRFCIDNKPFDIDMVETYLKRGGSITRN
jgi:hypothetical protein